MLCENTEIIEPVVVGSKKELIEIIKKTIQIRGNNCNLNFIDVSHLSDFSYVFFESSFNGDISQWDMHNAQSTHEMFSNSEFNGDISQWDTSNVIDMRHMLLLSNNDHKLI